MQSKQSILFLLLVGFELCLVMLMVPTMAQNTRDWIVVVRSYYNSTGMTNTKASNLNQKFRENLNRYSSTTGGTRHLRTDRELQLSSSANLEWCRTFCSSNGCSWCKLNGRLFGADCSRFCRRRTADNQEEGQNRELQTSSTVDGFASYPSDRNRFTAQQDAECAAMMASIVSSGTALA